MGQTANRIAWFRPRACIWIPNTGICVSPGFSSDIWLGRKFMGMNFLFTPYASWKHWWRDGLACLKSKAMFTQNRKCSDAFGIRSTLVRIHSVYTRLVRICNGTVPYRLRLHVIVYGQVHLGSDPLWYGSTLFTRVRFETGTVLFHLGSLP